MRDVAGRVVLVTGGASGIGRLLALDFARLGAKAAVWDLNAPAMKALEEEARAAGLSIVTSPCDVSDRGAVYRKARELEASLGPVDILVNNAGIVSGKTLLEIPDEKIEQSFGVNVLALFWTTRAFLPSMLERNRGHIVTIASAAGLIGVRGLADYSAGKFAAVGFDESLRMELRRLKSAVRTTVVCPYFIDTGMFEGVKTRFPFILPILKSEYAARRILGAVLKNKKRLVMPRFIGHLLWLRALPPSVMDFFAGVFGVSHAMDEFKGRRSGEENK